jgi:NAD(P)H-hydrate epimerase
MHTLTREQVRAFDRYAIETLGVPGLVLMENAGRGVAEAAAAHLQRARQLHMRGQRVAIVCGGGNNGGDGYVIARHLPSAAHVMLYATKPVDDLPPDARANARIAERLGLDITLIDTPDKVATAAKNWQGCTVVIDALLGTGFQGELRDDIARVIEGINATRAWGATVVAVDLPSGLDANTGTAATPTVIADLTVTFVALKKGFENPDSRANTGDVVVAGIGVPPELIGRI